MDVPIVYDNLARSQVDLVADASKVLFVFLKNALKGGFELEGCEGARPLELHGGIAARIHDFGILVELVGVRVVQVVVKWSRAKSRALCRRLHGARMAASKRRELRAALISSWFIWEDRGWETRPLRDESKLMVATVRKSPSHTVAATSGACSGASSRLQTPMLSMGWWETKYPNQTRGPLLMPNKPPMYVQTHINKDAKAQRRVVDHPSSSSPSSQE